MFDRATIRLGIGPHSSKSDIAVAVLSAPVVRQWQGYHSSIRKNSRLETVSIAEPLQNRQHAQNP